MEAIQDIIDIDYATDVRKSRRKTGLKTQEFFTPYSIIQRMMDKVDAETWADKTKTFIDPCFGNGNILLGILHRRIFQYNIPWQQALSTLYGVELMSDNVDECKKRICSLLSGVDGFDEAEARKIMDKNLVCADFFKWDFANWRPLEA